MCIAGQAGELTSEQGGIGYLMAFAFLMMAHAWRSAYRHLKDDVDKTVQEIKELCK
jgi:hypothetical protein